MEAPTPTDEAARLAALARYAAAGATAPDGLDDLTRLAAELCAAPIACVNLVEAERIVVAASFGIELDALERDASFCDQTIIEDDVFVVADTLADARFASSPVVTGEPHIRFYAGVALRDADGHAIGTLCVLDRNPRELAAAQRQALCALARQVMRLLDLRREGGERERAFRASEALHRELFENANDVVYTHDLGGRFTSVNAAGLRLYGYTREELLAMNIAGLVAPESMATALQHIREKADGAERSDPYEVLTHSKDGRPIWVEVSTRVLREDERPVAIHGIARDVTQRRQAEAEAHAAIEFRERVLESASNGIAALDLDGRFTLVNARTCEITGYSAEDLIGSSYMIMAPPERLAQFGSRIGRVLHDRDAIRDLETSLLRKDGQLREVMISVVPLMAGGQVVGMATAAEDITERRRSERLLASQQQALEMIASGAPLAETLEHVARNVETQSGTRCAVLLVDETGDMLHLAAAPSLAPAFVDSLAWRPIAPDSCPCGIAAFRGAPIISRDVYADPLCENVRELFATHEIAAAWATPILSQDRSVLGTLAMFAARPSTPDEWQMRVIEMATHVASLAIQRTRADEALRGGESRYRALAENALDLVCELDQQGRFVYVSPKFEEVLGYAPADLVGTPAFDVLHPDDRQRVVEAFGEQIANPGSGTIDYRVRRGDGGWCWIETSANFFPADNGETHAVIVSRDVGERMRIEESLRQSEEHLRSFVENAPVVLFAFDANGVNTLCEGTGLQYLGLQPGQLVGASIYDLLAERPDLVHQIEQALSGDEFETEITLANRVFQAHFKPLRDASGAVTGMIGVAMDVNDRVAALTALRDSELRLRTFVENAPIILFASDAAGIFTLYEGKGLDRLGLSRGQLVGRSIFDVYRDHPTIGANIERVLAGEEFTDTVVIGDVTFDAYHTPLRDDLGAVTGMIGVLLDVTARIQAEREIRDASDFRDRVLESATDGIAAFDTEGRFTLLNSRVSEMSGYSAEELLGNTPEMVLAPEVIAEVGPRLAALFSDGAPVIGLQTEIVRKDGTRRHVSANIQPIINNGKITGAAGTAQDVTERVRADHLLASQKGLLEMVAAGAALEDVFARLVATVEESSPTAACSVMLLAGDAARLRFAAAPSLPAGFVEAFDGIEIGSHGASCGAAAATGAPVFASDIATDAAWEAHRELAAAHRLAACWSSPILSASGSVLGTFAMYLGEARAPQAFELGLLEVATHIAGIAIERKRAETAVRSRSAELERMYKRLVRAHDDLEESKTRLEEKSLLLERALELERERSRRDPLTGTLNHAAITDMLRDAVYDPATSSLAIAMVDVDGLKAANDTFGHQIGDQVLALVAEHLQRSGATVGRYGGDEFVAILPGADRTSAEAYRRSVLASLSEARLTDAQTGAYVPVVASIGLAIYPEEAEAVDDLIRLSDSAMYASRRARAAGEAGNTLSRPLGGDRAAKMVGEIVPLLTSAGDLDDKLRLVAHRLSVGAGYDGVNFVLEGMADGPAASSAFARVPEPELDTWNEHQRTTVNRADPIAEALARTKRPIIVDDLRTEDRIPEFKRALLDQAGLRSALIAPMIWGDELIGALSVASKQQGAFSVRDAEFVAAVATQVTAIVRMSSLVEQLQSSSSMLRTAHTETVLMLASAAEAHDHTTGRHLQRVRGISEALARELGYDEDAARALGLAATLHDIGKIRVPDSVLGSSQSLAEAEWVLMKQHCLWGSAFLDGKAGFELATTVARYHHERWDGAGYPDGLAGDDIPEPALITTVADSLDAMTNNRPYRAGRPVGEAVAEIVRCSGTQFSPRIVDALVRLYERGDLAFVHTDDPEEWEYAA